MRFLSKFFKRWYLYMLPLIIFPVVATVYAKKTLAVYESSALLFVYTPTDGLSNFSQYLSPAINGADAMSQALQSESFCVSVARGTDLAKRYDLTVQANQDTVTTLIKSELSITPTTVGQNLVTVTADDKNPQLAKEIVASFITAFTSYYANNQQVFIDQQVLLVQGQLQTAQSQWRQDTARLTQYFQANPSCRNNPGCTDPTLANLTQAVTLDQTTVNDLSGKLNTLNQEKDGLASGAASLFYVSDAPRVPLSTTLHLKQLIAYPLIGFGAALALVLLIVGIQTFADRRVYSTQDLKALTEDMDLDIPAIESVPVLRGIGRQNSQEDDADGSLSGILLPVLTVLPQLGSGHMAQELRRVIGVTVEDEE